MKILSNLPKNTTYYIAGIGAIIALFAFFFAPFAIEVVSYTYPVPTSGSVASGTKTLFTSQFAEKSNSLIATASGNTTALAQVNGALWLDAVLVIAIIVVVALLTFRSHSPFGLASMPAEKQVLWAKYGLVGAALLSLLILWVVFVNATQILQNNANNQLTPASGGYSSSQASVQFDAGAWIFLIGLLAVIVAIGVPLALQFPAQLAASKAARATRGGYPPAGQYPPTQPVDPNQYPPTYPPYPQANTGPYPAQQAYPAQQPYPTQQPYPPQGQAYPPQGQFPPTQAYPPAQEPGSQGGFVPPQYPPQQP